MIENEVEIIGTEMTEASGGGFLDSVDHLLMMAKRADEAIAATNKMMTAALKITTEHDWVLIGGQPYLQESGATKVANLFGVSWQLIGAPSVVADADGYKTYTYKARFMLNNRFVECEGSRSMKEDFFAGGGKDKQGNPKPPKKPDEIVERDVQLAAYTNCINNGVKRLIPGLRNIDVKTLEDAGFEVGKIRGYTFKDGSKGGASKKADASGLFCSKCNAPITQAVASFSQGKFGTMLCIDCQKEANK